MSPHIPVSAQSDTSRKGYRVLMELGQGGMGVVHLAISKGPQGFVKLVVLKSLRPELVVDPSARRMFLEEARISARLSHPNIVQVFEVIEYGGAPTMVMEYLEGHSLWHVLQEAGEPLPQDLHWLVLCKVLSGLHAAHQLTDYDGTPLGLVHRDISPHNVFIQYDGQVKVLDFGIAKARGSEVETQTGVLKGKLHYMAPEQMAREGADRRADVFSVGLMLRESITGQRAWGDLPENEVMLRLLTGKPPLLEPGTAPEPLRVICNRALSADPRDRYATAQELQRALAGYVETLRRPPSEEALGAFVERRFGESRAVTNQLISSHVQRISDPRELGRSSGRTVDSESTERINKTTVPAVPKARQTEARPSGKRARTLAAGAVVACLAVLAAWGLGLLRPDLTRTSAGAGGLAPGMTTRPCGAGFKRCDKTCVSIDLAEFGCGAAGCWPCRVENATPRCNASHECDIAVCYQDFDDCDGDPSNGCETSVRLDPDHCGGCGHRCPTLPHAERGCGDVCSIWRCEPGYRDCNEAAEDGCEVDARSDPSHCGHCGMRCSPGQRCQGGQCRG